MIKCDSRGPILAQSKCFRAQTIIPGLSVISPSNAPWKRRATLHFGRVIKIYKRVIKYKYLPIPDAVRHILPLTWINHWLAPAASSIVSGHLFLQQRLAYVNFGQERYRYMYIYTCIPYVSRLNHRQVVSKTIMPSPRRGFIGYVNWIVPGNHNIL